MILANLEIHRTLDAKSLIVDPESLPRFPGPGQACSYGTHSVDLRLGPKLLIPQKGPFNFDLTLPNLPRFLEQNSNRHDITPDRPFILVPGQFVLGITLERVGLPLDAPVNLQTNICLAARIEGKSSRARCGLLVHFTAPTIHPGWDGPLALEMINLGPAPFVLKLGMAIAQLMLEEVKGLPSKHQSQFQGQSSPGGI